MQMGPVKDHLVERQAMPEDHLCQEQGFQGILAKQVGGFSFHVLGTHGSPHYPVQCRAPVPACHHQGAFQAIPQRLQQVQDQDPQGKTDFVGRDAVVNGEFFGFAAAFKFLV
jgi:hypothetical protein